MNTVAEMSDIREEITKLGSRLEAVEARLGSNGTVVPTADLADVLAQVRQITQEIFPGACTFTSECDPEHPDDRYVVVNVEATGDPKEIVDRGCVWDQRIRQLRLDLWDTLRLVVLPS
jgi:hypothetical protein